MKINTVTLLGHKDHGKSTMIGNLLIATKSVSQDRINDAKRTSEKLGRQFEPGFMLDSFSEEREGGLTIDTTRAQILYKGNAFEFIDVPGHEELIKNMISGASNAQFAVLMVSAKEGEGIKDQTLRHLFLASMLGIKKIIVAVNKMDNVGYSEKKFDDIKSEISRFLSNIGFSNKDIYFVPVSAYASENLTSRSKKMAWYKGSTLLDTMLAESQKSQKDPHPELRISVQGVLKEENLIIGKVLSGKLGKGDTVVVLPQDKPYKVSNIFIKGKRTNKARKGESVAFMLNGRYDEGIRGSIICGADNKIKPAKKINALIFAVKTPGKGAIMDFNGNALGCSIHINKVIDTTTGSETKRAITPLNAANVTINLSRPLITEPFSKSEELGRFVLYDKAEFAGIGIVI